MENKFRDFLNKNNGKFVEVVDASNYAQCFDLAIKWCQWLGLPINIFSGLLYAYQIYTRPTNLAKENFDLIPNTDTAKPQIGDVVVFAKSFNKTAGHVVIATGEGKVEGKYTDWFGAFSQNDPTGSVCKVNRYKFNHVLGWLRYKKGEQIMENCDEIKQQLKDVIELSDKLGSQRDRLNKEIEKKDKLISSQSSELLNLEEEKNVAVNKAEKYFEEADAKELLREKWFNANKKCQEALETCKVDRSSFQKRVTELEGGWEKPISIKDWMKAFINWVMKK